MSALSEWKVPPSAQPRPEDYGYDLERALSAVVGLHSIIPPDAFTAETLGVERAGNGVLIGDGLVLTVGYLITEAETIWLHLGDGRVVQGHALGFDNETGFGLVQLLARIDLPVLEFGNSSSIAVGDRVVVAGAGGRTRSLAGRIAAKQEFAGYWEYLLDEAIFTYPAHPNWGGTALISPQGKLLGIGSLQIERVRDGDNKGRTENLNMTIPIDLLKPILDDLKTFGRVNKPVRPWLGIYTTEVEDRLVTVGVASKGPAARAEIKTGDMIVAVAGKNVSTLTELYRRVWALGDAGVEVPLTLHRDGVTFDVRVNSSDRMKFLKGPRMH
jgi:S1-C subfamily serine protease